MKNILILTFADIRKRKSQSVGLLLFVLIAAMFMNIGFAMSFGIGKFFDERAEELYAEHFVGIFEEGAPGIKEGWAFAEKYKGVNEIKTVEAVGGWGEFFMNGDEYISLLMLKPVRESQTMNPAALIGEHQPLTSDAIYIPYFMFYEGGFELGDTFRIRLSGRDFYFRIAGATEEIMFGALTNSFHRFYISDEKYTEMHTLLPDNCLTLLSVRLENVDDLIFFHEQYVREISQTGLLFILTYDHARAVRVEIPMIAAVFVTAFSGILLIISLIVIRFRILNSIEENMTNIGAQKAVGFTSGQIISAIVIQFTLIALIGGILGIALSQVAIPYIINILMPIFALPWNPGFDVLTALLSIMTVLLTVIIISFLSSSRINRLHPLIALRGGILTHSFRKNSVPLEKSRVPLNFALSLKQILQNKKQAITISIIIALVTMMSVSAMGINYNMNEGREGFVSAAFGEMPEVALQLKNAEDGEAFKERMSRHPDVRKVFGYQTTTSQILVNETGMYASIVEDSSLLEANSMLSGRKPKHNNEIAIGTAVSKIIGKTTGDTVTVRIDETEKEYLISGVIQVMNNGGFNGLITADALRELQPDFVFDEFFIYLHDGVDSEEFIEIMRESESDILGMAISIKVQLETMFESIGAMFAAVAVGIVIVTGLIVMLVLYMVIKTTILRRKRELGIQKAVGFTTLQLMNQIALSMTPVILIGVVMGAVGGFFGFGPMMNIMLSSAGIVKIDLPVPMGQVAIICILLVGLAYAVSMAIARRIRKISAYGLVSE